MSKILFTCVGSTDPIRNNYDGAMLHIIRHFMPEAVYIFFTKEMGDREKNDNRYTKAIKMLADKLGKDIRIITEYSDIEEAHDFDVFMKPFQDSIEKISNEFTDYEILLNLSSGTPQMKSLISIVGILSGKAVRFIQVSSPNNAANKDKPTGDDYDVEYEFKNNLDNEGETENRCKEIQVRSFRKAFAKAQIISLINDYNYRGALTLVKKVFIDFDEDIVKLLEHANYRVNLKDKEAVRLSEELKKKYEMLILYPVADSKCKELCEYLNVLRRYYKINDITGFILRLNPFIVRIQGEFIFNKYKLNIIDKLCIIKQNGEPVLKKEKLASVNASLLEYLEIEFTQKGGLRDESPLNIVLLNCIIRYFVQQSNSINIESERQWLCFFDKMEIINQKYRNSTAHDLVSVTQEDIKNISAMKCDEIIDKLQKIIVELFGNKIKKQVFQIYEYINQILIDWLNRL